MGTLGYLEIMSNDEVVFKPLLKDKVAEILDYIPSNAFRRKIRKNLHFAISVCNSQVWKECPVRVSGSFKVEIDALRSSVFFIHFFFQLDRPHVATMVVSWRTPFVAG